MNAFDAGRLVEARGMATLEPFLLEKADGRLVVLEKGPLARAMQESVGDAIFQAPMTIVNGGRAWSVEIKIEESNRYGNLYLETWSNKNLDDRDKRAIHGSNVGWMQKLRSDLLLYYFIEQDDLYALDMFKLQRWAFVADDRGHCRIEDFAERPQGKRSQMNDTWGRCVPLSVLLKEVGYRLVHPKQLPLFEGDDNPW